MDGVSHGGLSPRAVVCVYTLTDVKTQKSEVTSVGTQAPPCYLGTGHLSGFFQLRVLLFKKEEKY